MNAVQPVARDSAPFVLDRPDIAHRAVCNVLCAVFPTVSRQALLSSERVTHTTAWVRHLALYLMAERLGLSHTQAGRQVGRDRTTVSYAVQLASQEADVNPTTAAFYDFLDVQVRAELDRLAGVETEWGTIP